MSFISTTIPHLIGGVSQQPSSQRLSGQGTAQENCYSSIVEGLGKRPPTHHIAKLIDGDPGDAFLHLINRDITERYAVAVTSGAIRVFDLDGDEKDVEVAEGAEDYITSNDMAGGFKAVTIADYTFLLNKGVEVKTRPYGASWAVSWPSFTFGDTATLILTAPDGTESEFTAVGGVAPVELITNGDHATSIDGWTPFTSAGAAIAAWSSADGGVFRVSGATNKHARGDRTLAVTPGSTYRVRWTSHLISGSVTLTIGTTGEGSLDLLSESSPVGIVEHDEEIVATDSTLYIRWAKNFGSASEGYIDNLSIQEVTDAGASTPLEVAIDFDNQLSGNSTFLVERQDSVLTITLKAPHLNESFYVDADQTGPNSPTAEPTAPKNLTPLVYVKQGNYGTNYTVSIFTTNSTPDFTFTHLTTNNVVTNIATDFIADALKDGLVALSNFNTSYSIEQSGSLLKITRADSTTTDFTVRCEDGNGDRNMVAIQGTIQNFADLPAKCFDGTIVRVTGDGAEQDDYFVRFNLDSDVAGMASAAGAGQWEEWRRDGETFQFDETTMPHVLIRQADGTFTFGPATWDNREAGDQDGNPNPSFVGRTIEDVYFFRNRLGFLADDNAILSEAGEYFNFWRNSVQVLLDGDPIDISAATTGVSLLRYAVPGAEKMLLISDQQQLMLTGGDLLTPKTASIKPTTAYEITGLCRPVGVGKAIYFTTPRGGYTGVREYGPDKNTNTDDAPDITAHVPAYIPANVFKMVAATNENLLALLTRDEPEAIYVYKFYFIGEDKLQSSWSKWSVSEGASVLNAGFINTNLYLMLQREDGVYLEVAGVDANRKDTGMEFEVLLDRRVDALDCSPTYNTTTQRTEWTLPYSSDTDVQMVVLSPGSEAYKAGQRITVTTDGTSVSAPGDLSAVPAVLGVPYEASYTLSELQLKTASANGNERTMTGARVQVRTLTLVYDRSGHFRVEVTPLYRDTLTHVMTPRKIGAYSIGSIALDSGEFRVPVSSKSDQVTIRIVNSSPYPHHIMSASWEAEVIMRSKRM